MNFLQDSKGNWSSTRLKSVVSLITAVVLAFKGYPVDVVVAFLAHAGVTSTVNKFAEKG